MEEALLVTSQHAPRIIVSLLFWMSVYSIYLESPRLFGAIQSRLCMCDFGPGVTHNTCPHMPSDGLILNHKMRKCSVGCYVTKYHSSS